MMRFVVFESAGGLVEIIEFCEGEGSGEDSLPDKVLGDNGTS
jgi:hypothetical protein